MQKATKATRVAAAMIAVAAMSATAQAQNLLLNGDFEAGALNQYGAPNWTVYDFVYTSGEYARTEGGKSLKTYGPFFNREPAPGSVALQSVTATANTAYTLSGYMFSPTGDRIRGSNVGILELHFLDASNAVIPGSGQQAVINGESPADTWLPFNITLTAPANAAKAEVVLGHIQLSTPVEGGAVFYDDLSLVQAIIAAESNWIATSSGGWLSASNWQSGLIPNAPGAVANFGASITAPSTVTIASAGVTAGTVNFNNGTNAYTIAGPGSLTLDVASGNAALNVTAGSHTISAPLALLDATVATVAAGQSLTLSGAVGLGGTTLTKTGAGSLIITGNVGGGNGSTLRANGGLLQIDSVIAPGPTTPVEPSVSAVADAGELRFNARQYLSSVSIGAAGKVTVPEAGPIRALRTRSLTIASGGTLDLGDNALVVDYAGGASPAADIRSAIITGKNGNFAGTGITSTLAASNSKYSIGYAEANSLSGVTTFAGESGFSQSSVLVRVTLKGDTDLSGNVNFADLVNLAQNYNGSNKVWRQGDSDYDGLVNFADLVALAQNYNQTAAALEAAGLSSSFIADWALAQSLVPEPTTLASLGMASLLLRRRSRA